VLVLVTATIPRGPSPARGLDLSLDVTHSCFGVCVLYVPKWCLVSEGRPRMYRQTKREHPWLMAAVNGTIPARKAADFHANGAN
jgi:hypothetical protein